MKVSVVIPVWNARRYLDPCIDSLLAQSMPADEFEVVFVDDGSTDDSPRRLDALAAEHPSFRVIHIPNSGWPGRPRNVGVEAARGEYVQFVDQDDHLGPKALERLYAVGTRNDADIVIGKVTSDFRGVPTTVFRHDREACTIADAPLIDSLTPHKMFRRAFLAEHGIAFPEGRRRLEDQLFVVQALFRAKVVSILASYPCYFYMQRDDEGNAGSVRLDPPGYYANLAEVLDVVVAETEPGLLRERLLRRFYRVEMLGRLSDEWYLSQEPAYQELLFRTIRDLAIERMDENVEAGLPPLARLRSRLLRANDPVALQELARRTARIGAMARIRSIGWASGRLRATFEASASTAEGDDSLALVRDGERLTLDPALTDGLDLESLDVTDDAAGADARASVRDRESAVSWDLKASWSLRLDPIDDDPMGRARARWVVDGVLSLDPVAAAGGDPLEPGTWDVWVRLSAFGLARRIGLTADDPALGASLEPALLGDPVRLVSPRFEGGALTVDVGGIEELHVALTGRSVIPRPSGGRSMTIALAVAADARTGPLPVWLIFKGASSTHRRRAWLIGQGGTLVVSARFGLLRGRLPAGAYRLSFELPGAAPLPLGTVRVARTGRAWTDGARRVGLAASAAWLAKRSLRDAARRLPDPGKARLRSLARR